MKSTLSETIVCDSCRDSLISKENALHCQKCGNQIELNNQTPIFTPVPDGFEPSEKIMRGPNKGTPWRQANWRFLEQQVSTLSSQELILDVGAGRGDFSQVLGNKNYIALDVYPYPEIDIVCDITAKNPFRASSFGAVLLMNVVEHIYDTDALFSTVSELLKPGGVLIAAIPFLVKVHQPPLDFVRYTHYALERLGDEHDMKVEFLQAYYDSVFFLEGGISNLKWGILPLVRGLKHYIGRILLKGIEVNAGLLRHVVGAGIVKPPSEARNRAPIGYHLVYRKRLEDLE